MAKAVLRTNHHNKVFHVLGLFSLLLLIQKGGAYEFIVGGSKGWTVTTDPNSASYNQWAEANRFQIGDSILFVYPSDQDSVFRVTKEDYTNCNTAKPIEKHTDGHTVFKFSQSGPHYFISGVKEQCLKHEKLVVVVMADRSNGSSTASPPPPGSTEENPSPAPTTETPPPNGASSIIMSFICSFGAFVGSSLLLVL